MAECRGLGVRELYVLLHLSRFGADYAGSVARVSGMSLEEAGRALERLEELGLAERRMGSAVKNTEAKLKLSHEVRKHHTYYVLTREGRRLARSLRHGALEECIDETLGRGAWRLLVLLRRAGYEHAVVLARLMAMRLGEVQALLDALEAAGLVHHSRPRTLKARKRKAKPKRETRCLHRYYHLTRLGEMLLRLAGGAEGRGDR